MSGNHFGAPLHLTGEWCADTTSHCCLRRPNDCNEKQHHRREAANRAASRRTEQRMALADVASTLTDPASVPWRTCGTCHALAGMSDEDAATLRRLLSDRGVKFSELAKALADDPESPTIAHDVLSRHARGLCSARELLR